MSNFLKTIGVFILILIFTVISSYTVGTMFSAETGNVALIKISGEIVSEADMFTSAAISSDIVNDITDAKINPQVKALFVEINSPGGTVVATREIASALKSINKTKICFMREVAASGAYWIASACDKIIADDFTLTGSIGVTGSYLEFSGLFEKYGIGYVRLVSGESKDTGTPYKQPTAKELESVQAIIDEMHTAFVAEIAVNRNMSFEDVSKIADGSIFTGRQALKLGLIDGLGGKDTAIELLKQEANLTEVDFLEFEKEFNFANLMSGLLSKQFFNFFMSNNFQIKAKY